MFLANIGRIWGNWTEPLPILGFVLGGLGLIVLVAWSVYWKGLALWKASKEGSKPWFVALLLINTLGILEILYIYVFSRQRKHQ